MAFVMRLKSLVSLLHCRFVLLVVWILDEFEKTVLTSNVFVMRTETTELQFSSAGVLPSWLSLTQPMFSRLFLVIEYVNGGDLMFHMQRQRKLPEEHAR